MAIQRDKKILIMTSVEAEKAAVERGLQGESSIDVVIAGVGPIMAGIHTMAALAHSRYDLVISAGIGGGFVGKAPLGSIVVSSKSIAADLGSQSPEGFMSIEELGFGHTQLLGDEQAAIKLAQALHSAGLPVVTGPILTLSTATGTAATAADLVKRVPEAVAEAMEGYGVAAAAHYYHCPFIEIRTISNTVGPRDRASWRIKEALSSLEQAFTLFPEVI